MRQLSHRRAISRSEFLRLLGASGVALALGEPAASSAPVALPPAVATCSLTPNVLLVGRRNVFRADVCGLAQPPPSASCLALDGVRATCEEGGLATFAFDGVVSPTPGSGATLATVGVEGVGFRVAAPAMLLRPEECLIYRTSVRGRRACRRCREHAANVVFASEEAARAGRAHPRCDCPIVSEKMSWEFYARAFWPTAPGAGVTYDRRWGWPAAIPAGLRVSRPGG